MFRPTRDTLPRGVLMRSLPLQAQGLETESNRTVRLTCQFLRLAGRALRLRSGGVEISIGVDYIRGERMVLPLPSARLFAIRLFAQPQTLDKRLIALHVLAS